MSQLIDFKKMETAPKAQTRSKKKLNNINVVKYSEELYGISLSILVNNNPNKQLFNLKEVAAILNVSEEFVRRRVKNNIIDAVYFGDRPMIQITELARLITEGVQ